MAAARLFNRIHGRIAAGFFFAAAVFLFSSCSINNAALQAPSAFVPAPDEGRLKAAPSLPEGYLKGALNLKATGKGADAERSLIELRKNFPDTMWALRASFLLGAIALGNNDAVNAEGWLNEAFGLKAVRDYALFHLARAKRMKGQHREAALLYDCVLMLFPDSPLRPEALYEKAAALHEGGFLPEAIEAVDEFITAHPAHAAMPDALLNYALWSWKTGSHEAALNAIRRIQIRYPASDAAKGAARFLAGIKDAGTELPQLGVEERFSRAQNLLDALRYNDAAQELSYVFKNSGGALRCRAASLLGLSKIRLKRYNDAEKTLRIFLSEETALCRNEADALYWLGLAALRLGRLEELARVEKRLASRFPDSVERAKVLTLLANYYEDNNDEKAALRIYRGIISKWALSPVAEQAHWKAGWIAYSTGRYLDAYREFTSYADSGSSGKGIVRFIYWSARAAERAGKIEQAASAYGKVCSHDARSFYCLLAGTRAYGAAKPVTAETGVAGTGAIDLFKESRYATVTELLTLGLTSRAAAEIDILMEAYKGYAAAMNALAGLYAATGEYHRALGAWKKYFQNPSGEAAPDEQALTVIAFPSGIVESIKKAAPEAAADPYLVAAVMREESSFDPEAVSPAGALGILQVMPKTGGFAAKMMGLKAFDRKALFQPDVNIRIGSWYLGYLASLFNNDLVLTIAGYNAGPEVAAQWVKTLPQETDEFIEAIPYQETRYYVKRVIRSYAEYLRASGLDPKGLLLRPSGTRAANIPVKNLELGRYVPASVAAPPM